MTPPNLGSAGRRPIAVRKSTADMLSLDKLIRDGPPEGDILGGLEATRLKILDAGIKSDSDGMVGTSPLQLDLPNS
jgi:cell cycle arrest protein BUB2